VLIVADDPLARAGLAAMLADQPGCTVVGQVAESADLPACLDVYRPEMVVWDLGWDAASASPSLEETLERLSDLGDAGASVVALIPDETHAVEAQTAGARGLLLRDSGAELLVAALMAAAQGLVVLDPSLSNPALGARDPARRLGISDHTVKFHVNAVLGKLGAQSRTEAVVRATRLGLILL
jgi:DNA-binding NarL/FixJ family response regulator